MEAPEVKIRLDKVGILNVYVPASLIKIGDEELPVIPKVEAYIDLPEAYRGIHVSRTCESIMEAFNGSLKEGRRIEDLCEKIALNLLKKHEYSSRSDVKIKGSIVIPMRVPISRKISYEKFELIGRCVAERSSKGILTKKFVGIKLPGIVTCPSAQAVIFERLSKEGKIRMRGFPKPTHMQRGYITMIIEAPNGSSIDPVKLVRIARRSLSSPTYELLKKEDEAEVIIKALNKPRFAEDVVRFIARDLITQFKDFPDETMVYIEFRSLESIHSYDLMAKHLTTFGKIRMELKSTNDRQSH